MLQAMKKNRKRLLAGFGVLLMVSFLISMVLPTGSMSGGGNQVMGNLADGGSVRADEWRLAAAEWDAIQRQMVEKWRMSWVQGLLFQRLQPGPMEMGRLGSEGYMREIYQAYALSARLARNLDPLAYLLLQKEAQRIGAVVTAAEVQEHMDLLRLSPGADQDLVQRGVTNFLAIMKAFDRVGAAVKVSQPLTLHDIADWGTEIGARLVEFEAAHFEPAATRPTTAPAVGATPAELAHFERFRNIIAGAAADPQNNPFAFGYKYPDRVKLDYLAIPMQTISAQVRVPERHLWRYYRDNKQNQDLFPPTTQLTTQPATQAVATRPAGTQAATTAASQPTSRPTTFADFKNTILDRRTREVSQRIAREVARDVTAKMSEDFTAYRHAQKDTAGKTATAPISSVGVVYPEPMYVQSLAISIAKSWQAKYRQIYEQEFEEPPPADLRFELPLTAVSLPDWLTAADLAKIGTGRDPATRSDGLGNAVSVEGEMPFSNFVMNMAAPLMSDSALKNAKAQGNQPLELLQPSPLFASRGDNYLYVFRLSDAQPAHVPASINEENVLARVRQDMALQRGYEAAKAKAQAFLKDAQQLGLQGAANASSWKMPDSRLISTGHFRKFGGGFFGRVIPGYPISGPARDTFAREAFKLMEEHVRTGRAQPVRMIELPQAGKVVVAEFDPQQYEPVRREEGFAREVFMMRREEEMRQARQMLLQWFEPQAVRQRLEYKPTRPETGEDGPPPPPPPMDLPPMF